MPSILIVDDEEGVRSSLVMAFAGQGYRALGAASAADALAHLARGPVDVVLTDLVMPGLDGLGLMERVREAFPDTAVILMTALGSVESAVRALKGGACDYVAKPFGLSEIFHVVARGLEQRRLRLENVQLTDLNRRLQELDQLKSNLLSAVSHEFRTPLTIMEGWLDLLLAGQCGPVPPAQQESLQAVRASAVRLGRLIANLLSFIQCERGEGIRERLPVDLERLASRVVAELAPDGVTRGIVLEMEVTAVRPEVEGDEARLRLLLVNLLENAIKFNEPGGAVRLTLHAAAPFWEVAVTNTRGEIPATRVPQLFLPFTQGDMGSTRPAGGLGLGLAVARALAQAHGGMLEVESGRGQGTTARLRLPMRVEPAQLRLA
jgi:signal transduction histidine kinase